MLDGRGERRRLHNEELNGLFSQSIMQGVKSKKMRGAGHGACMGGEERCIQVLVGNRTERDHLKVPGINGKIILRWIFGEWDGRHGVV